MDHFPLVSLLVWQASVRLQHRQMPFLLLQCLVNHQPILFLPQHLILIRLPQRVPPFLLDLELLLLLPSVHQLLVLQHQHQHQHPLFLVRPHLHLELTLLQPPALDNPHPCLILLLLRLPLRHLAQVFLAIHSHPHYLVLQPLQLHRQVLLLDRIPPPLGRLHLLVNQVCLIHHLLGLLEVFSRQVHHSLLVILQVLVKQRYVISFAFGNQ